MIKLVNKNTNLLRIGYTRSYSGNRFKLPKSNDRAKKLEKHNKEELSPFQAKKAEVERFRLEFWRKHDKKYYFGAHTFILYKQDERIKATTEEFNYEEQNIMKVRQLTEASKN